jgi:essential recombination function protein
VEKMNIYEKLLNVQVELKAPKGQFNKFGNYKYRSCEDILEALKPVLQKHKLAMYISDEVIDTNGSIKKVIRDEKEETTTTQEIIGKKYIKATITLVNVEKPEEVIKASAFAREEENKKGMDGSQITGASSSYARKYALNGLFAIDDTKDSDITNNGEDEESTEDKEMLVEIIAKNITPEELSKFLKNKKIKLLDQANYKDLVILHDLIMMRIKKEKTEENKLKDASEDRSNMIKKIKEAINGDKFERMLSFYEVDEIWQMSDEQLRKVYNKIFKK